MKRSFWIAIVAAGVSVWPTLAAGQQKAEKPTNAALLELTAEVAATTEEGYPSVLRITIKNVSNAAVDMPMPKSPCVPGGGGVEVRSQWHSNNPKDRTGNSMGWSSCMQDHFASLMDRVHYEWIRIRPDQFIVVSESFRTQLRNFKPGTVEYWVEYIPPEATAKELAELRMAGYNIPTEKIETPHQSFSVR